MQDDKIVIGNYLCCTSSGMRCRYNLNGCADMTNLKNSGYGYVVGTTITELYMWVNVLSIKWICQTLTVKETH